MFNINHRKGVNILSETEVRGSLQSIYPKPNVQIHEGQFFCVDLT